MMKLGRMGIGWLVVGGLLIHGVAQADRRGLDSPHSSVNSLSCLSCHYMTFQNPPDWVLHEPQDIDDTAYNNLCWSCHNNVIAPHVAPHSSLETSTRYGTWSIECRACHWVHQQMQYRTYGAASYVASGNSSAVDATTLTVTGAGWAEDQFNGYLLVPNTAEVSFNYPIIDTTGETLTVAGPIDLDRATAGDPFAIVYGNYIKSTLRTPNSGSRTVRFFRPTGPNSFADGTGAQDGVCEVCHTQTTHFRNDGTGSQQNHENIGGGQEGTRCVNCHAHTDGFAHGGSGGGGGADGSGCGSATACHGTVRSHTTHVSGTQLSLACIECHAPNNLPSFRDGAANKEATTVCDNCHAEGAALAKQYWAYPGSNTGAAGSWRVVEGEASFCGSCHDATPGNTKGDGSGDNAFNVLGDGATFGFYVTGHGKPAGTYGMLSFQPAGGTGNPAAGQGCAACHDLGSSHFGNAGKRLAAGFENDQQNANCNNCHAPGQSATHDPQFYTTSAAYEGSAHGSKLCTDCHEVHGVTNGGSQGTAAGMTKANQETLCANCHANGGHPGVGSASYAIGAATYTLECVSCHNVHVVTGTFAQAPDNKSPVTRITDITNVWGDAAGEKMSDYAGSGTYRVPNGGYSFPGDQLPDYATFCLTCHGQPGSPPFGINWTGDAHGTESANQPNGYGTCPNWFACGKAFGWDNDDCQDEASCWPARPRGWGDQLYSREPYTHLERVGGANFTLSCTDCHTGHGTGTLGRANVNGGTFTSVWNTMCNNCHYYYSDWHAGMACGNASCHVSDRMNQASGATLHGISHAHGSGGIRTPDQTLACHLAFSDNLQDSGGWQLDGIWRVTSGAFTTGKVGRAIEVSDDPVEIGTENAYWSTDAGYHGTWVYTEMKNNMTLEAWVYPTSDTNERKILAKHTYWDGGYALVLKQLDGSLKVGLLTSIDGGGPTTGWDSEVCNGLRGAFSSVTIPLNDWTHVAATYDAAGPDRNPADGSVGRIRIYVNGEDVTTSYANVNSCYAQPGTGETSMFPYSDHNDRDPEVCYNGQWCASALSVGGLNWSAPNDNFIGRLDEVKIWNVTKNVTYFAPIDASVAPRILSAKVASATTITVAFSEGVYTSPGQTGALVPADFVYTDLDNGRTITGVSHAAGASTATLTLSAALDLSDDIGVDTVAAAANAIFENQGIAVDTTAVAISGSLCPDPAVFPLNEPSCSATAQDAGGFLTGTVNNPCTTFTGDGSLHADGTTANTIIFADADTCLGGDGRALTVEARVKPTGASGTANYIKRIISRTTTTGNWQLSAWRNNSWAEYEAPAGQYSFAFWVRPVDAHGGQTWKPVKTDYLVCPLVSDHWYQVRAVWNSDKAAGIPGDIFVDDQGTDGNGAGEAWSGYINCTNASQSQNTADRQLVQGDVINIETGDTAIGSDVGGGSLFQGLIDWVQWQSTVDYTGVQGAP
ncbi:MAG: LamG-like jellyroll fold domain-containing protein [Thermodesulfobacteriota bacterium]